MSIEAMKQWLEALEHMCNYTRAKVGYKAKIVGGAMDSLRQAIAEAEQEQGEPVPFNLQVLDEWTAAFKKETDYWKARHDILLNSLKKSGVEPVGEMQLSAIIEGAVVPVVAVELPAGTKLYTTPQQRTWVDLTDEEVNTLWDEWKDAVCLDHKTWAQAIRARLKEKNT